MPAIAASAGGPDPDEVLRLVAAASGMEFLPMLPAPSSSALALLPRSVAAKFSVAPVSAHSEEFPLEPELCLAISEPLNFDLIDSLRFCLRRELQFIVAPPAEVQRIIAQFYPKNA